MSTTRYFTQEIFETDCIGDSSSKHNYNFLNLDTEICNVSSQYTDPIDGYYDLFSDFMSNTAVFDQMTSLFFSPERFNKLATTTEYLSSYWEKHEFTVHYPLNISTVPGFLISCPTINQTDPKLISLVKQYISTSYLPENYTEGTIMNVIMFLYNVPVNPYNSGDLMSSKTSAEFSYMVRHMYVEMAKQDVHLANGRLFKFIRSDKEKWQLISIETGGYDNTKLPILKNEIPPRISTITSPSGRQQINITISTAAFKNLDVYYEAIHTGLYYPGYTDVKLIIQNGSVIGCDVKNKAALTISGFVPGDTITIENYGTIVGYGGQGGHGVNLGEAPDSRNNGLNGGIAIRATCPVASFLNNGLIGGGGGGGAGGLASYTNTSYLTQYSTTALPEDATLNTYFGGGGGGSGGGNSGGDGGQRGLPNQTILNPSLFYTWTSSYGESGAGGGTLVGGAGGNGANTGGSGGDIGEDGVSTGPLDFIGRQLSPIGGKAGAAIIGRSFIDRLYTTVPGSTFSYGDIRGSL